MKKIYSMKSGISILLILGLLIGTINADTSIPIDQLKNSEMCYELGLIIGNGKGVDSDYLESSALRIQAAVIMIRLMGKEQEMLEFEYQGKKSFADVSDFNIYEQRLLAYLYANKDLGWVGNANNEFSPNKPLTAKEFTKVLLVSLGYKQNIDFKWENVFEFSQSIGMTKYSDIDNPNLNVAQVADLISEALTKVMKDQRLLVEELIEKNIVEKDIAVFYDLIRADLKIEYVDTIAANQIKIYLNVPIDYVEPRNILISGIYVQDVVIKNSGEVLLVYLSGVQEGKTYTVYISGAKYGNTTQRDTSYTFEY